MAGLGYLLKERVSQLDELVRALHEVARGGSALDPKVVEGLMARKANEAKSPLLGLTEREREVLAGDGHRAQQRHHRQDAVHERASRREAHRVGGTLSAAKPSSS